MSDTSEGAATPALRQSGARSLQELTSLDERLGLLLLVRVAIVLLALAAARWAGDLVRFDVQPAAGTGALYLIAAGLAEWYRRTSLPLNRLAPRIVVPLDAAFLVAVVTASGDARSPLLTLVSLQVISVTLLHSARSGVRAALWDCFLLVLVPAVSVEQRVGHFLGVAHVGRPRAEDMAIAITGLLLVAAATVVFSFVSERELRRGKAELAALADLASSVEGPRNEEEVLSALLSTVAPAFGFRRAAVVYRSLVLRWTAHPPGIPPGRVAIDVLRPDRSAAMAFRDRSPQLVRVFDPSADPVAAALLPEARNVVVLPLQLDGDDGVVMFEKGGGPRESRLPIRTLATVVQCSAHAVLALRNARLLAERGRLAAMDGLTGLANRREFDRVLAREVTRSGRRMEPLSLAVFDVDHFKAINDTRGHLGGDEVLRALARVLTEAVREVDLVARYGGEEFAVVLPDCDQHNAIRVVERIMTRVRSDPDLPGVTVSAGVATIPFNASDGTSLVAAADEAMYRSKRAGRDRYSVSGRHPDAPPAAEAWNPSR